MPVVDFFDCHYPLCPLLSVTVKRLNDIHSDVKFATVDSTKQDFERFLSISKLLGWSGLQGGCTGSFMEKDGQGWGRW